MLLPVLLTVALFVVWLVVATARVLIEDKTLRDKLLITWHIAKRYYMEKGELNFVSRNSVIAFGATLALTLMFTVTSWSQVGSDNLAAMLFTGIGLVMVILVVTLAIFALAPAARAFITAKKRIRQDRISI